MIVIARLAILVGLAGLLPFLAGAAGLFLMPSKSVAILAWFYIYSAGILAFMAGVYWPIALQLENRTYPQSPMVCMLLSQAFFITAGIGLLLQTSHQIALYTVAYLLLYWVDARWMRHYWPSWYLKLRLGLTLTVVVCQIAAGAWFYLVHNA
ncbi:DUF3429 domain-containing protein [Marinobacter persicus]|uniref:Uncharacterized protein DUF3429 n=1 Tax=Marinobacter persicus TaxID=930118 RepID=A0A2S6GA50_9GAMM|nr:DUF3429 domain-containing protein [Marinobacter persicus]KXS51226.1 MAG: hypothetical protein AWU57_4390 [Marinobacter sp. T13-3]PPK53312.1 uncharacterized protein DUF3429 [Marinobacter persicus]PPK56149.1 uncharacterized protein DUF3429 [Marinobacter persicus]PPK59744.1 uncharacterized protein DUF3429 [Marinobacter persicus]